MRFDEGVKFYTRGTLTVTVNLPEGERKCKWCPFYRRDNDVRARCLITNRILYSAEWIPDDCPITFESEEPTNEGI